jgi:hypothetical protein
MGVPGADRGTARFNATGTRVSNEVPANTSMYAGA